MLVPAGRINKPFGTEGGLMLSLYADFPEEFTPQQTPLFVEIDSLDVPLWCERFERRGISGAVASFADFDTERRAAELVGLEFRIESGERDDDEFYLEDLIGFHVEGIETRHEAEPLHFEGRLTDYYDSEANPLFELETGGRRVLVPAVEEFIAHIDFEQRSVKLVLPEGMTDL
ncbi:ribosome maturation factor RimM [uncultured Alistipes sp.]|jgi:16S rRNA processing protein RimM|uniref:ribosome maturation factor RimM n=1 Tax=uncultured Alistipes sp. TaxID=538949 RepID=UPI001F8F63FC|nr:ribosome maturation factor RimM [uncultured Alistipes sp.]HJC17812.1 ribosome maturation factor RimM [Candidatus Alistipes stercorigallinarum]